MFYKLSKMSVLLLLIACIALALVPTGCKMQENTIPEGCENSLIYTKLKNPMLVDSIMQTVTIQAVKKNVLTVEKAETFLNSLELLLVDDQLTYSDFFTVLQAHVNAVTAASTELVVAANALDAMFVPTTIDACDLKLLKTHIEHQKNVLEVLKKQLKAQEN